MPDPDPDRTSSADEVHARLVQLATWRQGLTWQRGKLLSPFQERQLWLERGHASFHQGCDHRFGLSPREVSRLIRLSRQACELSELDAAWREGRVDESCVAILRQVAEPDTVHEWLRLIREEGLLVRMGRAVPGRLLEWYREGIRVSAMTSAAA